VNALPDRLLRRGRPVDPVFAGDESLYRRVVASNLSGYVVDPLTITFPTWSVDRGKYALPEDVLLPHYLDCGIAEFRVGDVPRRIDPADGKAYTFAVVHVPVEDHYPHSEVQSSQADDGERPREPGRLVQQQFRYTLARRMRVIRQPQV
jgi:hypothetical protein